MELNAFVMPRKQAASIIKVFVPKETGRIPFTKATASDGLRDTAKQLHKHTATTTICHSGTAEQTAHSEQRQQQAVVLLADIPIWQKNSEPRAELRT